MGMDERLFLCNQPYKYNATQPKDVLSIGEKIWISPSNSLVKSFNSSPMATRDNLSGGLLLTSPGYLPQKFDSRYQI